MCVCVCVCVCVCEKETDRLTDSAQVCMQICQATYMYEEKQIMTLYITNI